MKFAVMRAMRPAFVIVLAAAAQCCFAVKLKPGHEQPTVLTQLPLIVGCGPRDDRAGSWTTVSLSRFITYGPKWSGFVVKNDDGRLPMAESVANLLSFLGVPYGMWRASSQPNEKTCGVKDMQGECHAYEDKACWSMEEVYPVSLEAQYYLAALHRAHGRGSPSPSNGKINVAMHYRAGDVRGAGDGHFLPISFYAESFKKLKSSVGDQLGTCSFFAEDFNEEEEKEINRTLPGCHAREKAPIPDVWTALINAEVIVIGRSQFEYTPAMFNCGIVIAPDHVDLMHHQSFDNFGLHKEPKWLLGTAGSHNVPGADAIRQQVASCRSVGNTYMQKDMVNSWPFGPKQVAH